MNLSERGGYLELKIALILTKHNWVIYRPLLDNVTVDTIAISPTGQVYKLQIKSARITATGFQIKIVRSNQVKYNKSDVDYFVTMYNDDIYLFPYNDFLNITSITVNLSNKNFVNKYRFNYGLYPAK